LTLVDLPGLFYGDKEATALIKDMYMNQIKNKNAIILYVTACTNDLNTGEALALARQADPENQRTLTVATKIDLCEKEHFVT